MLRDQVFVKLNRLTETMHLNTIIFVACLILFIVSGTGRAYGVWQPIIGIPKPPFGIDEVAPTTPSPWNAGTSGFYYVEPSHVSATDIGNPYGYPSLPRVTIPNPIPAGTVVEVHGAFASNVTINAQGTSVSPVFVRGTSYANRAVFGLGVTLMGTYLIIENVKTEPNNGSVGTGASGFSISEGNSYITIRNAEISGLGNLNRTGSIGLGSWSYGGVDSVSYVVLDNLDIHDIGDVNAVIDQDGHGVALNGSVDHVWIVNSEMARCSGDGVQIEAQQSRRDKIHHIYLGKNISHDNKQTGMWIKHATDIIFSENTIYGHRAGNSSFGQGTGFQYGPDYVWFLFNRVYDNAVGIAVASNDPPGDGTEAFFIGNIIYNIHSTDPGNQYNAGAMMVRGGTNIYIINNVFHDSDAGINAVGDGRNLFVYNNIFSNRTESLEYDMYIPGSFSATSMLRNNIFNSSSGFRVNWNGSTYTSLALFQAGTGEGQNSLVTDPLFFNAAAGNFYLNAGSPAIDAGVEHAVYTTFLNRYGISIAKDITGVSRPQPTGGAWDIGAYEGSPSEMPSKLFFYKPVVSP